MKVTSQTILFLLFPLLFPLRATAQISADGTTSTTVTDTETGVIIENGDRNGGNLFHSFDEFSLPSKTEAFFNNSSDIVNIFSRVTGGRVSNIDGLIRANGTANLFLINPAGIVFGNDASLQLGGSFYGSTADSIIFPEGEFSAVDLDNPPLITVNAPVGLSFRDNPRPITNRAITDNIGLQVNEGQSLNLIGGDVTFEGGIITARGATVWLGGVAEAATVDLDRNLTPAVSNEISRADVTLTRDSRTLATTNINVASDDGGAVTILGNDIIVDGESRIIGGIARNSGTLESQAGDITLDAAGAVEISEGSRIDNRLDLGATGNTGDINITADSLTIDNGATLNASLNNQGQENAEIISNAGDINITTTGAVIIDGSVANSDFEFSFIASGVRSGAVGNGGNINISAGSLSLINDGVINTRSAGRGNAGNIIIDVDGAVDIIGSGDSESTQIAIDASLGDINNIDAIGSGGNIEITANSLSLTNNVSIRSSTFARGDGGTIRLNASESIAIDSESSIDSNISSRSAEGNTGGITIDTTNLSLANFGRINSSNILGEGNAGKIAIDADTISIVGESTTENNRESLTGIFSAVGGSTNNGEIFRARGNTGGIEITTTNLNLSNGGEINANTFGRGDAGKITVNASNVIDIEENNSPNTNTGIFSAVGNTGIGNTGGIEIVTANLNLKNGGRVNATTFGRGNPGRITVNASDSINIEGRDVDLIDEEANDIINNRISSGIFSNIEEGADADTAGDIAVATENLILSDGGTISASTFGQGDGGSLSITAREIALDEGTISTINQPSAASEEPREGGNITLEVAETIFLRNESTISARAGENASGGNITIEANSIVAFPNQNSDIIADAEGGNGGNINIFVDSVLGIEERSQNEDTNDIDASSESGISGNVSIETPDNNPFREDIELSDTVVTPEIVATNACQVSADRGVVNTLVIKGKGGISVTPTQPFDADALILEEELNTFQLSEEIDESMNEGLDNISSKIEPVAYKNNGEPVYIARGIIKERDGTIVLTAASKGMTQSRKYTNSFGCN